MNGENKSAYQEALIEKLKGENKSLLAELKECKEELLRKEEEVTLAEEALDTLKRQYEQYLFRYDERVESLAEAKLEYERAAAEVKALMKKYRKEAEDNLRRIREAV